MPGCIATPVKRPMNLPTFVSARPRRTAWALMLVCCLFPRLAIAQIDILTNRYDQARTGANLSETTLTTANVNSRQFGKLFSYPVDGSVYAQPLYVSGVTINGVQKNVLYIVTMNDRVYAFDADSSSPTPLWSRNFTNPPSVTPVPITDIAGSNLNVVGNVGIQSTPVIDRSTNTIYFVARTKENGEYVQRLHALNITTGASRPGSPMTITASAPGTAEDAANGLVTFDPKVQIQRAALALTNGVVIVSWAAHEDMTPSHGWIMGFDASTLARVGAVLLSPDGYLGGVWQGGRAPAIDSAGNVYIATGNGPWDGTKNFGDTLLKLQVSRTGLTIADYFTPANEATLNLADDDLSGSGFTLLPGNLLLGGGKEGVLYLLNAAALGHKQVKDAGVVQRMDVSGGHVMGGPVFWRAPSAPTVYNWSEEDVLKAFSFTNGRLSTTPVQQGSVLSPGHPGGSLIVSANGSTAGTGIVWAHMNTSSDAKHGLSPGILRAFDAETLEELWNSELNSTRDRVGTLMKFVPPVVVNGRVYVPNQDNQVVVYGLLASGMTVQANPNGLAMAPGQTKSVTIAIDPQGSFASPVTLKASGYPAGWTVTLNRSTITAPETATMTVSVPASAASGSSAIVVTGTAGSVSDTASVKVTVSATSGGAGSIAVDFVGDSASAMATGEVAGVVPQGFWNAANGATRTSPLALVDASGAPTGATITWRAGGGTWATPIAETAGASRMMKGYLDTSSTAATTVTVAGLPSGEYDVYIYVDGDNRAYERSGSYAIAVPNGATSTATLIDAANANFAGSFVTGAKGNYVRLHVKGTGFTLTATPVNPTTGTRRAPVNGIQIVPATAVVKPNGAVAIDFVGTAASAMSATEVAGVVAQSHWNAASGASRSTPLALVDASGASTSASVTWSATGTWATPVSEAAGNARMMKGYLDATADSTTTVSVTGLASREYDVYIYVDGDNKTYARSGTYVITVPGASPVSVVLTDAAGSNFAGAYSGVTATSGSGNYIRVRINGGQFTISATPKDPATGTRRAPINGLQIVPAADPAAATIGVDFVGTAASAMAASESAGVVPQTHWVTARGAASTARLALKDSSGTSTSATMTWVANGTYATPITETAGNARMMKGYLDTSASSTTTIDVIGLAEGAYDIYVYVDGANGTAARTGRYTVSVPGATAVSVTLTDAASANFGGTFTPASGSTGNYVRFHVTGTSFTLTAVPISGDTTTWRAPVNGIQIVPAP